MIYEQSNLDHVLGVVSQTRVSGGYRTHDPHANSLALIFKYYCSFLKRIVNLYFKWNECNNDCFLIHKMGIFGRAMQLKLN